METLKTTELPVSNFLEACRENTGAHFLDSGSAYGRHHEKPPMPKNHPIVSYDPRWNDVTIHTGPFLEDWSGGIDTELQAQFEEWQARDENTGLSWFEAGEKFCVDILGLEQVARDNVYNGEQDLSQVYIWEVYNDGQSSDWLYPDDSTVTVFYIHTGCDVRGGYGRPLFVRPGGGFDSYSVPVDLCAGWYPIEAHDSSGQRMEDLWEVPGIDEISIGYHGNPSYYTFNDYADRVFGFTATSDTVCILTRDGYRVKIGLEARTQ